MIQLLKFEWEKLIHKPRTFLSIGLMILLFCIIFWGLKTVGTNALDYLFQSLDKKFMVEGTILNGSLASYLILNTLWIHVPILIVIITGDLFSSEFEGGTIRLLMTRPISRYKVALSKHSIAIAFVLLFFLSFSFIIILPAFLLFGKGDLMVAFNGLQIIEESELPWRFAGAISFAFLAMCSFAIFSVTVSLFSRKSLISILITLGVIIVSTLIQTLATSLFMGWDFFLITYHFAQWQLFFYSDIDWVSILHSVIWLFLFSAFCIIVSIVRFNHLKITE